MSLWIKSRSVTTQMKAAEQYFPVVLPIQLYKVVLTFESVDKILKCDQTVLSCGAAYSIVHGGSKFWVCGWNPKVWPFKWKYFPVVLFIMLYNMGLSFESVDKVQKCNHSNEDTERYFPLVLQYVDSILKHSSITLCTAMFFKSEWLNTLQDHNCLQYCLEIRYNLNINRAKSAVAGWL